MSSIEYDYDAIVVGSGFGGSVSAMRLSQKGYRVGLFESGKRWPNRQYPKTNWNLRKFLWMPMLGFYGIQRINILKDFLLVSGAGVGGGSLVYANTLYVPGTEVLNRATFRKMGGEKKLLPFYEVAKHMLGVTKNPRLFEPDHVLQAVAEDLGKGDSFTPTPVGVYFGDGAGKTHGDPYFLGDGPERVGCNFCGGCMVGCRFNSKNTLDKNYLYFAEQLGTTIHAETKVVSLVPLNSNGQVDPAATGEFGYEIETHSTTGWFGSPRKRFRARSVVLSAAVMGTVGLLLKMREGGQLPRVSPRLGDKVRTNSETVLVATKYGKTAEGRTPDYSHGVAITSSIHVDEHTHIEPVRYPAGADFFGLLASPMTDGGGRIPRPLKYFWLMLRHPIYFLKASNPFGFAKRSMILLVMQTLDNSIRLVRERRVAWPFRKTMTSALEPGSEPSPTYIPVGNEVTRRAAEKIGGIPRSSLNEVLLNAPVTGHIMGGCVMGDSPETGVIDGENRVHGYENLRVCDGSMLTENLGVNPSLTITALSERAMSFIPPKAEDVRSGKALPAKPHIYRFEREFGLAKTIFGAAGASQHRRAGAANKPAAREKSRRAVPAR